jgi:hypothetical protein
MKSCVVIIRTLLLFAFVCSFGCQSRAPTAPISASQQIWQSQEHEVGEVTAGFEIAHRFTLTNDLTRVLKIQKDRDIIRNCGCADITSATRELAPEATTTVTVKVATRDKSGPFSYGGRIIWTDSENTIHIAVFLLTGVARPPLAPEPNELVFEREDVAKGQNKELRLTVNPAVDEASLTVEATKALAIEQVSSQPGSRVYAVKCLQQPESEDEEIHDIYLSAKLSPKHTSIPVSTKVVVRVREAVPLSVQPKSLDLRVGPDGRAIGKLALAGDAVKGGDNIESITCGDYKVEWKRTRASPAAPTSIVEITVTPPDNKAGPEQSILYVKVKGLAALHVPIQVRK